MRTHRHTGPRAHVPTWQGGRDAGREEGREGEEGGEGGREEEMKEKAREKEREKAGEKDFIQVLPEDARKKSASPLLCTRARDAHEHAHAIMCARTHTRWMQCQYESNLSLSLVIAPSLSRSHKQR